MYIVGSSSLLLSLSLCTLYGRFFRFDSVLFVSGSVNIHSHFLRLNGEDGWGDRCVECYSKCTLNAYTIHFLSFSSPILLILLYTVLTPYSLPPPFPHTHTHSGSLSISSAFCPPLIRLRSENVLPSMLEMNKCIQ